MTAPTNGAAANGAPPTIAAARQQKQAQGGATATGDELDEIYDEIDELGDQVAHLVGTLRAAFTALAGVSQVGAPHAVPDTLPHPRSVGAMAGIAPTTACQNCEAAAPPDIPGVVTTGALSDAASRVEVAVARLAPTTTRLEGLLERLEVALESVQRSARSGADTATADTVSAAAACVAVAGRLEAGVASLDVVTDRLAFAGVECGHACMVAAGRVEEAAVRMARLVDTTQARSESDHAGRVSSPPEHRTLGTGLTDDEVDRLADRLAEHVGHRVSEDVASLVAGMFDRATTEAATARQFQAARNILPGDAAFRALGGPPADPPMARHRGRGAVRERAARHDQHTPRSRTPEPDI